VRAVARHLDALVNASRAPGLPVGSLQLIAGASRDALLRRRLQARTSRSTRSSYAPNPGCNYIETLFARMSKVQDAC